MAQLVTADHSESSPYFVHRDFRGYWPTDTGLESWPLSCVVRNSELRIDCFKSRPLWEAEEVAAWSEASRIDDPPRRVSRAPLLIGASYRQQSLPRGAQGRWSRQVLTITLCLPDNAGHDKCSNYALYQRARLAWAGSLRAPLLYVTWSRSRLIELNHSAKVKSSKRITRLRS
jgi:hypothetical protein